MRQPERRLKPCILVIEDEAFIRNIIATHLEYQGYDIVQAENGQDGFSLLERNRPDAIVCDILMPREDGIAFCRRVRARGIQTPILFLSAKNQAENVLEGLSSGADDYLVKPFQLEELSTRVARLLGSEPEPRAGREV